MVHLENLSLVILNYNSLNDTVKCVQALLKFNSDFHIILVDNQSTDGSFEELEKKYGLNNSVDVLLSDKNGGYSYGNNFGVRFAKDKYNSDFIGIINPDVIIPNISVFEEMILKLGERSDYAMIGGSTITNGKYTLNQIAWNIPNKIDVFLDRSLRFPKVRNNSLTMIDSTLAKVECITGCFFIIKMDIFEEMGFFDENVFLYNEENILGIKLKRNGYTALISTNSFYYHNHVKGRDNNNALKKKLSALKIRYKSRSYLIKNYYPKFLIIPLLLVEGINGIQISLGHLKNKIKRQLWRNREN